MSLQMTIRTVDTFKIEYKDILRKIFPALETEEIDGKLIEFLESLDPELVLAVEFPYVDKSYRDSYYLHYSSKHQVYPRDTIRVSIFQKNFNINELLSFKELDKCQSMYLGYFVIRPTKISLLGRNYINPKAFRENNFVTCLTKISTSIYGVPLSVNAFPHSTQDRITSSCAETSIWSIMEYFGNKYSDYSPALTSKITKVISDTFFQRSIPSNGLNAIQISSALRSLGFLSKIYSIRKDATSTELISFKRTISNYIESGIPIVVAVKGEGVSGHAFLLVGHEEIDLKTISLSEKIFDSDSTKFKISEKEISLIDSAEINKKFISIDDNKIPYQSIDLDNPLSHYNNERYRNCKITSVIVPLHSRIYMESNTSRKLLLELFKDIKYGIKHDEFETKDNWVFRMYLTSAKSFKRQIYMKETIKRGSLYMQILRANFPKFLWVGEFAKESDFRQCKGNARLILDATGDDSTDSLLFAQYPKRFAFFGHDKKVVEWVQPESETFDLYRNNLKGEWNKWNSN